MMHRDKNVYRGADSNANGAKPKDRQKANANMQTQFLIIVVT